MNVRLILAIVTSLLEQAGLVAIVLWGLPHLDIKLPVPVLVVLMVAWAAYSVITYRMGSRALRRKPVAGLPTMVGTRGRVVRPLAPMGMVRIKDELWEATASGVSIEVGEEVTVVGQDGLRLVVSRVIEETDDTQA